MAKKRTKKPAAAGFQNRIRELRQVPAAELQRNPKNWRLHPERQQNALKSVLDRIGYVDALIAREDSDGTLVLIDGHLRADVSSDQNVPVLIVDVTEEEADAILASFDSVTAMAEVDEAKLQELLGSIEVEGLDDLISDVGTLYDLALEGDAASDDATVDPDEVPPAPKKAITKPGDLWILGNHRLLCGDSTKAADVERLMDGEQADLWVTDPPYNVDYTGKTKDALKVANDAMENDAFRDFLEAAFANAFAALKPGASFYIWHADSEGLAFRSAVEERCGQDVRQCLIWNKDVMVMGRQDYHWKHEPCLYGWKGGGSHKWYSDRTQTTVLEFARPKSSQDHPTMKPVDLISYLITNSSEANGLVLDTFCGSGTTLIAAEQLKRRCCALELSPNYCDVIVRRWEEITGEKAKRSTQKRSRRKAA